LSSDILYTSYRFGEITSSALLFRTMAYTQYAQAVSKAAVHCSSGIRGRRSALADPSTDPRTDCGSHFAAASAYIAVVRVTTQTFLVWICAQEVTEARYVATMKTIRQVKTVFVIFIAFVCCWSPYIVVLLFDNSDRLPLPVHLYTSMLAHLHASLNFAIYSLSNRASCFRYQHHAARLVACCFRRTTPSNNAASTGFYFTCDTRRTTARGPGRISGIDVNKTLLTVERHQFQEIEGSHDAAAETFNASRTPFSVITVENVVTH